MAVSGEKLANLAVVVMSVVVTYTAVDRFTMSRPPAPRVEYTVGEQTGTTFQDTRYNEVDLTALLVISSTCHFCEENGAFFRRLVALKEIARPGGYRTVILAADGVSRARAFAAAHRLAVDDVRTVPAAASSRFTGTPTLLVIDKQGLVVGRWTGVLSDDKANDVIQLVTRRVAKESRTSVETALHPAA